MKKFLLKFSIEGGMHNPGGDVVLEIRAENSHVAQEFARTIGNLLKYGSFESLTEIVPDD